MLALSVELAIIEVAKEEELIIAGLPVIKVMAEVLLAAIKLLIGEVIGETGDEVSAREVVGMWVPATLAMASPVAGHMVGLLPMMTMDSSSRLHDSSPHTSSVPDPHRGG